ncbi:MAG TPA: hypothetical protein VFU69_14155, partial [Ktedonobacterales bacterium]|nr:hypothetical protein [Ktedonobacterales bacterium]
MAEASLPQKKPGKRTNLRWSALAGGALGVLFAVPLYFLLENEYLKSFSDQWWMVVFLAYALLVGLLFFVIGFLRGRATGDANAGVGIVLGACLMQIP